MGAFQRLIRSFRSSGIGPAVQRGASIYGSAYAPAPPTLHVPEELRRAVDEENLRRAAEERRAGRASTEGA
jgi:hypothetical protein